MIDVRFSPKTVSYRSACGHKADLQPNPHVKSTTRSLFEFVNPDSRQIGKKSPAQVEVLIF